ncbi:MAG: hypothetical protein ABWJ98_04150 [Hydrogenothermaceae bacterium]
MGSSRTDNTTIKHKIKSQKGATLIFAIAASLLLLIVLGGIYYFATKFFKTSEDIKVYSSSRDAAAGAVNYAVVQIIQNKLNLGNLGQCTGSGSQPDITLKYKLSNDPNLYTVTVKVCFIGYEVNPGYDIAGVAYSTQKAGGKGEVYSIVAKATGPLNTVTKIEASYVR